MKIGLIDVDGHHYPNLTLMKISAWHKARGDTVEWWWSDLFHYIVPLNPDTMEPDGPAEVFGDWQADHYLPRVLELIHPNRQINVPDLAAMVRAAAEDGLDLCEYCQAPYMCRDCIVKEWKEDPGGE